MLTKGTQPRRNADLGEDSNEQEFSIFYYPGRGSGRRSGLLDQSDLKAANLYVLFNCVDICGC